MPLCEDDVATLKSIFVDVDPAVVESVSNGVDLFDSATNLLTKIKECISVSSYSSQIKTITLKSYVVRTHGHSDSKRKRSNRHENFDNGLSHSSKLKIEMNEKDENDEKDEKGEKETVIPPNKQRKKKKTLISSSAPPNTERKKKKHEIKDRKALEKGIVVIRAQERVQSEKTEENEKDEKDENEELIESDALVPTEEEMKLAEEEVSRILENGIDPNAFPIELLFETLIEMDLSPLAILQICSFHFDYETAKESIESMIRTRKKSHSAHSQLSQSFSPPKKAQLEISPEILREHFHLDIVHLSRRCIHAINICLRKAVFPIVAEMILRLPPMPKINTTLELPTLGKVNMNCESIRLKLIEVVEKNLGIAIIKPSILQMKLEGFKLKLFPFGWKYNQLAGMKMKDDGILKGAISETNILIQIELPSFLGGTNSKAQLVSVSVVVGKITLKVGKTVFSPIYNTIIVFLKKLIKTQIQQAVTKLITDSISQSILPL